MANLFKPFRALRVQDNLTAGQVLAPPYDVLSGTEAQQIAAQSELSFVHVSRAEVDLPASAQQSPQEVHTQAAIALKQIIASKALNQDAKSHWYIIEICDDEGHRQVGFGGLASCAAYKSDAIAQHELTRHDKENDRMLQIETVGAQTGPVLLVHEDHPELQSIAEDITQHHMPDIDAKVPFNRANYRMWVLKDDTQSAKISAIFDNMQQMWIADGHHRAAAACRLAEKYPHHEDCQWFLATSFPASAMKLLAYHRFVQDCSIPPAELVKKLQDKFSVAQLDTLRTPNHKGEIIMLMDTHIYVLTIPKALYDMYDNIAQTLDVSILTEHVLSPILDIHDLREDQKISFIGSNKQPEEICNLVKQTQNSIAFLMYPVQMQDIMDVASDGQIMPPKSTWFEPKLADGLINHLISSSLIES